MASPRKIAEVGAFLGACFTNWKPNPDGSTFQAWEMVLGDVPDEMLELAAQKLAADGREWPPNAGQLRQAAFALHDQAQGVPDVDQAVAEVHQLVKKSLPAIYGETVEYSHPIVRELCHAAGGLETLKMSENWTADRARLIQLYEVVRQRHNTQTRQLPAVGQMVHHLAAQWQARQIGDGT